MQVSGRSSRRRVSGRSSRCGASSRGVRCRVGGSRTRFKTSGGSGSVSVRRRCDLFVFSGALLSGGGSKRMFGVLFTYLGSSRRGLFGSRFGHKGRVNSWGG